MGVIPFAGYTYNPWAPYRIDLFDDDLTPIAIAIPFYGSQFSAKLNEPMQLQFSTPANWPIENVWDGNFPFSAPDYTFRDGYLRAPYILKVYRGTSTDPWKIFRIVRDNRIDAAGGTIIIDAMDPLCQLGQTPAADYFENKTAQEMIEDWLGYQTITPAITLGNIWSFLGTKTLSFKSRGGTVLKLLRDLQSIIGGYFYVDTDFKLNWKTPVSYVDERALFLTGDINNIQQNRDDSSVINYLTVYWKGISVTAQDATSQSTYGVRKGEMMVYKELGGDTPSSWTSELTTYANDMLDQYKEPRLVRTLQSADLGNIHEDFAIWGSLVRPGTKVKIITPDDFLECIICGVTGSLNDPTKLTLSVTDPSVDNEVMPYNGPLTQTEQLSRYMQKTDELANAAALGDFPNVFNYGGVVTALPDCPDDEEMPKVVRYDDGGGDALWIGRPGAGSWDKFFEQSDIETIVYNYVTGGSLDTYIENLIKAMGVVLYKGTTSSVPAMPSGSDNPFVWDYTSGSPRQMIIGRPGGTEYKAVEDMTDDDLEP